MTDTCVDVYIQQTVYVLVCVDTRLYGWARYAKKRHRSSQLSLPLCWRYSTRRASLRED